MYDDCLLWRDETTLVLYLKVLTVYSTMYPVMLICQVLIHSPILSLLGRYWTCSVNTRNNSQKVFCLMEGYYCQALECNRVLFSTQSYLVLFKWLLNLVLHNHFCWQPWIGVRTSILTSGSLNRDFTPSQKVWYWSGMSKKSWNRVWFSVLQHSKAHVAFISGHGIDFIFRTWHWSTLS